MADPRSVELTLLTKPGCHLCDEARVVVTGVVRDLEDSDAAPRIGLVETSILDDPALFATYAEEIPVLLIDGRVHTIWRVEPERLRSALLEEPRD